MKVRWLQYRFGVTPFLRSYVCGLFVLLSSWQANALAQSEASDGALRVEILTAYNLVVDSNAETPATYAPSAAYLSAKIHNDGSTTLTNVFAYIGNQAAGTPGIYPQRAHPPLVGPLGGEFALTHEGGSLGTADATRYFGTIPANSYVTVYWLISYPSLDENGNAVWGPSVKPDDDLWLEYDIWATAGEAGVEREASVRRRVTMRNEISAAANKILPNGANKVPQEYLDLLNQYVPSWTTSALDGSPGTQVTTEGVWYDLGNVGQGFDNDGDGIPDYNAWLQPVGDPDLYDPGCFRLVRTYALVIVKLTDGSLHVIEEEDLLYFENLPVDNNGAVGWVGYEIVPIFGPCTSQLTPYQEVASGFDNEKFNGDFGAGGIVLNSGEPHLELVKDANLEVVDIGGRIAYTVTFTNTGDLPLGDPLLGAQPTVISDSIPAGTQYVLGSAAVSNTLPVGVSSYSILYSTNSGISWVSQEPAVGADVTDLQWWLSDAFQTSAVGVVTFEVDVDNPYLEPLPVITNVAGIGFGNGPPVLTDDAVTRLRGDNSVGDTVFADIGAEFGNGIQELDELGIPNISLTIYYDSNLNGEVDGADLFFGTEVTDGSGGYLFDELPDGQYIVVVDDDDADLPFGYTSSTPTSYVADLDQAGADVNPVSDLDADFGFAPALRLVKELLDSSPVYEGQVITYSIDVSNELFGNGTGFAIPSSFTEWADALDPVNSGTGTKAWLNETNAYQVGEPEGSFATAPLANAAETIALTGFQIGTQPGTITNVEFRVRLSLGDVSLYRAGDNLTINLLTATNATPLLSTNLNVVTDLIPLGGADFLLDATAARAWDWSDFPTNVIVQLIGDKGSGNDQGGDIHLDGVAVTVDTDYVGFDPNDAQTLQPVPLFDIYEADKLEFVSATPGITSTSVVGDVGTLYWENVGEIYPGGTSTVEVSFKVLEQPNNGGTIITNIAEVNTATYLTGRPANSATDSVETVMLPAGTIGDFVWRDLNTNGVQDAGAETGIAGVSVILTPPATVDLGNGLGGAVTTVTDSAGLYLFESLPGSGAYTVTVDTVTLPGGAGSVTNTWDEDDGLVSPNSETIVNLDHDATDGSDTHLTADFGYVVPSQIEGTVWNDLNMNGAGTPDTLEPWMTNVTVRLLDSGGSTVATTTTDANGYFLFVGTYNGTYTIQVDDTTGPMSTGTWVQSFDTDDHIITPDEVEVSVVLGGTARGDFSYYETGVLELGDTVFYDWNGDAIQGTSDEGIPNITMSLYRDLDGNGLFDPLFDALISTNQTDSNGQYFFTSLPPADYLVVVDEDDTDFPFSFSQTFDPDEVGGVCTNCDGYGAATLVATNNYDVDFGYQPQGSGSIGDTVWIDSNGNGIQLGLTEVGISNITVSLYVDFNGDGTYVLLSTNVTDASGNYLFTGLPAGDYRVVVDSADADLPEDSFGNDYVLTTPGTFDVALSEGQVYLDADFGFTALGAIGDTIFWDSNINGSQDFTEPGISNVTVHLYQDVNSNDFFDVGTDLLLDTQLTDTNGLYLFDMLAPGYYVVVVDQQSGPISNAVLTADPDSDGIVCGDPGSTNCDHEVGTYIGVAVNFMGADFGYIPYGVIGDTLWIDTNANDVRDAGEAGIPFVTVFATSNGVVVATTETDADGYYYFENLPDGTYSVEVDTTDPDLPTELVATYDADGLIDNVATNIVISGGSITSINGTPVSDADLDIDFGYRYPGNNELSGTIGLDGVSLNGVMGSGPSGVDPDESPFEGVGVFLSLWTDADTNGVVDTGELTFIASTTTDALGDYSFTGLPTGGSNDQYYVSITAPSSGLTMTTTTGDTPATVVNQTTNLLGETLSASQVLTITSPITNVDFAFVLSLDYDFGDLPSSYSTLLGDTPAGPSHVVPTVPDLYLGATVDSEPNGQPSTDASGDGADEDGVVPVGAWNEGTDGGSVTVQVGAGSGWLVGWVDFNQNGAFTGTGEMIISTNVSAGTSTYAFDIPAGSVSNMTSMVLNARFRLFESEPAFPQVAFTGDADNGEVEDYQWIFGALGDFVWNDEDGDGIQDVGEAGYAGLTVNLYDPGDAVNPIATTTTDGSGYYYFGGTLATTYVVEVVAPVGGVFSPANQGGDDALDSDVSAAGLVSVTMTEGEVNMTIDAGLYIPGSLDGHVFLDVDTKANKGTEDTNGIAGVTIQLLDSNSNLLQTATTDADGYFSFPSLPPTDYIVREIDPATYVSTTDTDNFNDNLVAATVPAGGNAHVDFWDAFETTHVLLAGFDGLMVDGAAVLQWQTAAEVGTVGFYLLRSDTRNGRYVRVTEEMIPGLITAGQGGTYQQVDPSAAAGETWYYILQEVDAYGKVSDFGPFRVDFNESGTPGNNGGSLLNGNSFAAEARQPTATVRNEQAQAAAVRLEEAAQARSDRNRAPKRGDEFLKLSVSEPGLQAVPFASFESILSKQELHSLTKGGYRLTHQGTPVAYHLTEDAIVFYAAPMENHYTDTDVFWLDFSRDALLMEVVDGEADGPAAAGQSFQTTVVAEEDHWSIDHLVHDPDKDYWYWDYLGAGHPTRGTMSFPVVAAAVADGPARITVNLHGFTDTAALLEHHAVVALNGVVLGDVVWGGGVAQQVVADLPAGLLTSGTNWVEITAILDPGVWYSYFVLDSIVLDYERLVEADDGILHFTAGDAAASVLDLLSDNTTVLEISNPDAPKLIEGVTFRGSGADWEAEFATRPGASYFVCDDARLQTPTIDVVDSLTSLHGSENAADYVIIVPPGLGDGASALADYRAAQGLDVMVVPLETLYDEFNSGLPSPLAIRAFLAHAMETWTVAPRYVVLAGSGTFDYKDHMGYGNNLIPPLMVGTPFGIFSSDSALADVDGDGKADLAIGRLPALNSTDLLTQLEKIRLYEAAQESWKRRISMIADNPDKGGDFHSSSDLLKDLIDPGYDVEDIHIGPLSGSQARTRVLDAFQSGRGLMNYVGHGGLDRMADEGLLLKTHVASLENSNRPSVLLALTCSLGRFAYPVVDSLGEDLVQATAGGAVALWSPSGLSVNANAESIGASFFSAVFQEDVHVLGDGIVAASQASDIDPWAGYIFNLLGDPALRILSVEGTPGGVPGTGDGSAGTGSGGSGTDDGTDGSGSSGSGDAGSGNGDGSSPDHAVVPLDVPNPGPGVVVLQREGLESVDLVADGVIIPAIPVSGGLAWYLPAGADSLGLRETDQDTVRAASRVANPRHGGELLVQIVDASGEVLVQIDEQRTRLMVLGLTSEPLALDVTDPSAPVKLHVFALQNEQGDYALYMSPGVSRVLVIARDAMTVLE